jgi:hypothetical protein
MSWSVLYAIDAFAILTFGISYFKNCYRRGYRIDLWHAQLFFTCVFPNMLLLAFTRNEMNLVVLGDDFDAVMAVLPTVFLITIVGYFSMLAGGTLWSLHTGAGLRKAVMPMLEFIPKCSMMLMSSRSLLILQSLICLVLQ